MSARKWAPAVARDKNIVSSLQFNADYDQLKGTLNGGLDRTSSPDGWCTRTYLVDNAFHSVTVTDDGVELAAAYRESGASEYMPDGVCYDNYVGGWVENTLITTSGLKIGFLHVEFSCFLWQNDTFSEVNPTGTAFQLLWNGSVIAETGMFYTPWCDPYMCVDIPVSGDGTLALAWHLTPPLVDVEATTGLVSQMAFGGGQLLLIARYR